jgi:hypothetical protein
MTLALLVLFALGPARADTPSIVVIETTLPDTPITTPATQMDRSQAPNSLPRVEQMLAAWHPEDLPVASDWLQVTDAAVALIWLADHAALNRDRQRALSALRHFEQPQAQRVLFNKALDPTLPELIRLGALSGLRGQRLTPPMCEKLATELQEQSALITNAAHRVTGGDACSN